MLLWLSPREKPSALTPSFPRTFPLLLRLPLRAPLPPSFSVGTPSLFDVYLENPARTPSLRARWVLAALADSGANGRARVSKGDESE